MYDTSCQINSTSHDDPTPNTLHDLPHPIKLVATPTTTLLPKSLLNIKYLITTVTTVWCQPMLSTSRQVSFVDGQPDQLAFHNKKNFTHSPTSTCEKIITGNSRVQCRNPK
jgi:hypothetical protein